MTHRRFCGAVREGPYFLNFLRKLRLRLNALSTGRPLDSASLTASAKSLSPPPIRVGHPAVRAAPRRPPDPVQVIHRVGCELSLDDVLDVRDIHATRRGVGAHERGDGSIQPIDPIDRLVLSC